MNEISDIQINEAEDTIRMYGILYSLGLFRDLGLNGLPVGAVIKIVGREKGIVHLQRLYDREILTP